MSGPDPLRLHAFYRGKVQTMPKCAVRGYEDFAVWYTPGVAAPARAIEADPEAVWKHTNRGNTVAIVTDGTRVLGLGDIGPEASLPVMEGKALLFKLLGGVDAVPVPLATTDEGELVRAVELLEPGFGAVNLEDIAQPKCFAVLDALRGRLSIPVWHDDQQGSATAVLAGLLNALEVVGKRLGAIRIALVGTGAAGIATHRLLTANGVDPGAVVACDSRGTLHPGRADIEERQESLPDKWRICVESNAGRVTGGVPDALRGADVCIAFSRPGPGIVEPAWVAEMAPGAIVFACANPVPEIWPHEAREAGARIVATGRSDFPNQVNNSLVFPGLFRGVLDVRATAITDSMAAAVAHELARAGAEGGLGAEAILPRMDADGLHERIAVAAATAAQAEGLARVDVGPEALAAGVSSTIRAARESAQALMRERLIPPPPV